MKNGKLIKIAGVILVLGLLLAATTGCKQPSTGQGTTPLPSDTAPLPSDAPPQPTDTQPAPVDTPANAALPAGDSSHSLNSGDMERTYILHVPPGYDGSQPVALVLAFHGLALDANEMIRISGLSPFADTAGFIVAYPNGSGQKKSWSSGHCCGEAALRNVDDVAFVRSLIADISSLANIDPRRIYATGFSNGAIFTYYLACEMADQIAAFAPLSATQVVSDQAACQPSRPVPLLHFHGTADRLNPYNGGTTSAGTEFTSVEQAIAFWVTFDGCPASPVRSTSGSIVHDLYSPCSAGSVVELYTITGGEHAWPGGEAVSAQVGEPNMEISANEIMWEFFQQHPLP